MKLRSVFLAVLIALLPAAPLAAQEPSERLLDVRENAERLLEVAERVQEMAAGMSLAAAALEHRDRLALTAEQIAELDAIQAQSRRSMGEHMLRLQQQGVGARSMSDTAGIRAAYHRQADLQPDMFTTVYRLSQFYNALNAGFEQLDQLRELSENVLIPNLGRGQDEFYTGEGELRPKYRWYTQGLQRLAQLSREITEFGDSLVADLGSGGEALSAAE